MSRRSLEVSFRKGRPVAAYLYLRDPNARTKVARTREVKPGILIDFSHEGHPTGVEILQPREVTKDLLDEVLKKFGESTLESGELEPLHALRKEREDRDEDKKDLFTMYALTTLRAQAFEAKLNYLLLLSAKFENREPSAEEVDQTNEGLSPSNLNVLLSRIQEKIHLDESYSELFEQALTKRNFLIHHFFPMHSSEMKKEAGRETLISRLQTMSDLFKAAEEGAEAVRSLLQRQMGWEDDRADRFVSVFMKSLRDKSMAGEEGAT